MFLNDNKNIIKYIKVPNEKTDKFALKMINNGEIKNLIVCGENNIELLYPISNLTPLSEYLKSCSYSEFLSIFKEAVLSEFIPEKYLLGQSQLVNQLSKSYVENGVLKLICIPTDYASAYRIHNVDFLLEIIGAWLKDIKYFEFVCELKDLITVDDYNHEKILKKINEFQELYFEENKVEGSIKIEENSPEKPSIKENHKKNKKSKSKFKNWFFGNDGSPTQILRADTIPEGISVISVRSLQIEYPLAFGPDILGSNENMCSIAFPGNKTIDKEHCKITFESGRYYIEDLNSTSGTFVNNEKIEPKRKKMLCPADLIKIGNEELVYSIRK